MKNYGLGYKLIVEIPSGGIIPLTRTIFVNEHGYYQIPSNVNIQNLYLYDNQIATIDYLVQ